MKWIYDYIETLKLNEMFSVKLNERWLLKGNTTMWHWHNKKCIVKATFAFSTHSTNNHQAIFKQIIHSEQ